MVSPFPLWHGSRISFQPEKEKKNISDFLFRNKDEGKAYNGVVKNAVSLANLDSHGGVDFGVMTPKLLVAESLLLSDEECRLDNFSECARHGGFKHFTTRGVGDLIQNDGFSFFKPYLYTMQPLLAMVSSKQHSRLHGKTLAQAV